MQPIDEAEVKEALRNPQANNHLRKRVIAKFIAKKRVSMLVSSQQLSFAERRAIFEPVYRTVLFTLRYGMRLRNIPGVHRRRIRT